MERSCAWVDTLGVCPVYYTANGNKLEFVKIYFKRFVIRFLDSFVKRMSFAIAQK